MGKATSRKSLVRFAAGHRRRSICAASGICYPSPLVATLPVSAALATNPVAVRPGRIAPSYAWPLAFPFMC